MLLFRRNCVSYISLDWRHIRYAGIHTAFTDAVKYRSKPEASLYLGSVVVNEGMKRLTECFQRRDCKNFDRALSSFTKTTWQLSSAEKNQLSSMITILLDEFSEDQIAYLLRNLVLCGFSVKQGTIEERTVISAMKTQFLKTNSSVYGKILFLTALNKLQYTLEESEDDYEGYLLLIQKISSEKLTAKQFAEFVNAVVGIGISWSKLTLTTQERLIKQILQIDKTIDTKTTFSLLYGLLTLNEKNLLDFSEVKTIFLKLLRQCLQFEESEEQTTFAMHVRLSFFFFCCFLLAYPLLYYRSRIRLIFLRR
jgi:hypothetical protein